MAAMIVLYGVPTDRQEFEGYYADTHIPFAVEHLPNVTGAQNLRVLDTAKGDSVVFYRVSQMSFDSADALREAINSEDGQAVLADLDNFASGGATALLADD